MVILSCDHIRLYKRKEDFMPTYELLHALYVSCIIENSLKKKARDCVCMTHSCIEPYRRIHACLSCPSFGCFDEAHIHEHARTNTHLLAVDTNYGFIYCFECGDYQYDTDCEKISHNFNSIAAHKRGTLLNYRSKWSSFYSNHLSDQEIDLSTLGLKGIINMKGTCYLTVIIQSLVHAPAFRDYFLSLNHRFPFWAVADQKAKVEFNCVTCEMADIVQEIFSVEEEPFTPHLLLYFIWKHDSHLIGGYQDAHHCFLTLLDSLHPNCSESSNDTSCKCFIGKLFTGDGQHKYTCNNCSAVFYKDSSFKHLPLVCCPEAPSENTDKQEKKCQSVLLNHTPHVHNNIPLTGENSVEKAVCQNGEHKGVKKGSDSKKGSPIITQSFDDCFQRAMQCEINDYYCSTCQKQGVKELTILKKLPVIINFLIKDGRSVDSEDSEGYIYKVRFPDSLDMSVHMRRNKRLNGLSKNPNYQYYLFAAVEYIDKKESKKKKKENSQKQGHYVCYIKQYRGKSATWFKCDDATITKVESEDVFKKKMYMLFYHKKFFVHDVLSMEEGSFS